MKRGKEDFETHAKNLKKGLYEIIALKCKEEGKGKRKF
jgi:hypothetical protein